MHPSQRGGTIAGKGRHPLQLGLGCRTTTGVSSLVKCLVGLLGELVSSQYTALQFMEGKILE